MKYFSSTEIDVLMAFFSPDGYVFDLSDERYNEFTKNEIGIRVKDLFLQEHLSKGKSLRRYITTTGNEFNGHKLLTALMRYYELKIKDSASMSMYARPESEYNKCKKILESVNPSKLPECIENAKIELMSLYEDGSYFTQYDGERKVPLGLERLVKFLKACLTAREVRIFGNPLFIRTITELSSTCGDQIRPTETKMAEGNWHSLSNSLGAILMLIEKLKPCPFETTRFKLWLKCHESVTESTGLNFYRSISTSTLTELVENCKKAALSMHPPYSENLELMYCGVFDDNCNQYDFLPIGEDGNSTTLPVIAPISVPNSYYVQNYTSPQNYLAEKLNNIEKKVNRIDRTTRATDDKVDSMNHGLAKHMHTEKDVPLQEAQADFGLNPRYACLKKYTCEAKIAQLRAAIDYSYNNLTIHPPVQNGTTQYPTITDLARIVWDANCEKWLLVKDSYQTLKDYSSALNTLFHTHPEAISHYDK